MSSSNRNIRSSLISSDESGQAHSPFVARLREALGERSVAWLAKESGVTDASVRKYLNGSQPTIIPAVQLSSALGVTLDWLLAGIEPKSIEEAQRRKAQERKIGRDLFDVAEADWVFIPHYTFESAFDSFAPLIRETYPVRKDWLNQALGTSKGLWMTDMPGDDLPEVAKAGETVICRNSVDLTVGKAFILGVDGHLVVRRLALHDGQIAFSSDRPDVSTISLSDDYVPVGQILARYGVSPVHAKIVD